MTASRSLLAAPASLVTMFVACFALVILFAGILQQIGAPLIYISLMMMVFVVGLYLFSGLITKTMRLSSFQTADKSVIPFFNGMSIASGVVSGSVFILYTGYIYSNGTDFLVLYLGTILGIGFLTVFFSASAARCRKPTLASLLFAQKPSRLFAGFAILIVLICSFLMLLAQVNLLTLIMGNYYEIAREFGVGLVVTVATISLLMGGMQSLMVARILAYPVIFLALLIPIAWVSYNITGNPVPQLSFGEGAVTPLMEIDREMVAENLVTRAEIFNQLEDHRQFGGLNFFAALATMVFGFSVMPHLLQHFNTVEKGRQARKSGIWAFALIALVFTLLPAAAMFAKFDLYTALLGLEVAELGNEAAWIFELSGGGTVQLITICGELVSNVRESIAACGQPGAYFLSIGDIGINPQYLMLSFAMLGDLPQLITVIIVTGALLAIFSTIDGLLLVMANTMTVDFYHRTLKPKSPPGIRLFMTRFFLVLFAGLLLLAAPRIALSPELLFSAAVSIAAASLFPALLSRIWMPNLTDMQIGCGMIAACGATVSALILAIYGPDLVSDSGDELSFLLPGMTEPLEILGFGLPGAAIYVLTVLLVGMIAKAIRHVRNRSTRNAHA